VWNYEVGTKLELFDGRLSLDGDVFYIDWSNIQVNVDRGDGFNGFMNAGRAAVKGVELSGRGQLTDHLRMGGQFTYTDGKITDLGSGIAATGVAAVGDAVPAVPKVSTSGFMEWGTTAAGGAWVYARGDVSYTTTRYGDFAVEKPIPLRPYAIGGLRLGIDQGPNSASLFVNNITDRRAMLAVQNFDGVHDGQPYSWLRYNINIPRTVGIAYTRRF
jgi:outer membrane receptor protein involved in Fe transport